MIGAGLVHRLIQQPGHELISIFQSARDAWRAGRRPILAAAAATCCVATTAAYGSTTHLHAIVDRLGAVTAALPLRTELGRIPRSAFMRRHPSFR